MSELNQVLIGVDIALGVIATLKIVGAILDARAWKVAMAHYEQELRDHPPSTATTSRIFLSGKGDISGS